MFVSVQDPESAGASEFNRWLGTRIWFLEPNPSPLQDHQMFLTREQTPAPQQAETHGTQDLECHGPVNPYFWPTSWTR